MLLHRLHEVGVVLPNWQVLPLLKNLPEPCGKGSPCVLVDLHLGCGRRRVRSFQRRGGASVPVIVSTTESSLGFQRSGTFLSEVYVTVRVKQSSIRDTHVHMSYQICRICYVNCYSILTFDLDDQQSERTASYPGVPPHTSQLANGCCILHFGYYSLDWIAIFCHCFHYKRSAFFSNIFEHGYKIL